MAARLKLQLSAVLALAMVAGPAQVADAALLPPGNSAVNQYTESYPTGRGEANAGGREGKAGTPEQALGKRNAGRLESEGAAGEEVAALVVATAPPGASPRGAEGATKGAKGSGGGATDAGPADGGSSAFGEVLDSATASSADGGLSVLLPLALLATALWALLYAWRRRRPAA